MLYGIFFILLTILAWKFWQGYRQIKQSSQKRRQSKYQSVFQVFEIILWSCNPVICVSEAQSASKRKDAWTSLTMAMAMTHSRCFGPVAICQMWGSGFPLLLNFYPVCGICPVFSTPARLLLSVKFYFSPSSGKLASPGDPPCTQPSWLPTMAFQCVCHVYSPNRRYGKLAFPVFRRMGCSQLHNGKAGREGISVECARMTDRYPIPNWQLFLSIEVGRPEVVWTTPSHFSKYAFLLISPVCEERLWLEPTR